MNSGLTAPKWTENKYVNLDNKFFSNICKILKVPVSEYSNRSKKYHIRKKEKQNILHQRLLIKLEKKYFRGLGKWKMEIASTSNTGTGFFVYFLFVCLFAFLVTVITEFWDIYMFSNILILSYIISSITQ